MIEPPAKRASNQFVINAAEFLSLTAVSTSQQHRKIKALLLCARYLGVIDGSMWTHSETTCLSMQDGKCMLLV